MIHYIYERLFILACDEGPGICSHLMTLFSILLIMATMPLSLLWTVKVVQVTYMMMKI